MTLRNIVNVNSLPKSFYKKVPLLLFFICFLSYIIFWTVFYITGINKTLIPSEDILPSTFLPASIVMERDMDLDEFVKYFYSTYPNQDDKKAVPFYLRFINDRYISGFPVVNAWLAVPVYLVVIFVLKASMFLPFIGSYFTSVFNSPLFIPILGKLAASAISSFSVVIMYLIAKKYLSFKTSLLLTFIYAFGTSTFAVSSQAMWQHGTAQLLLLASLFLLMKLEESPYLVPYAGLFLSLATMARPTMGIVALVFTLYVFLYCDKYFKKFVLLALIPLLLWFLYNYFYFGDIFTHAYNTGVGTSSNWIGRFPEGLLGLLISPSKGLFIYSPVLLYSLFGLWLTFRRKIKLRSLTVLIHFSFVAVILYLLVMGKWYHWYGGWSFSYRMILDVVPLIILFLIPVFKKGLNKIQTSVLVVFAIYSLIVQITGLVFFDGEWHARFDNGPVDTNWLWSVRNSELVYYSRKVVCKVRFKDVGDYLRCQGFQNNKMQEEK